VPVVANGKAYVAAYKSLTIFGANGTAAAPTATAVAPLPSGSKRVTGVLTSVRGSQLTLSSRSGKTIVVDATAAQASDRVGLLEIGQAYTVIAPANTPATLWRATSVSLAKLSQAAWPPDE
jgi:outer membrane lipoprotein SlyB